MKSPSVPLTLSSSSSSPTEYFCSGVQVGGSSLVLHAPENNQDSTTWDGVVDDLKNGGVALLDIGATAGKEKVSGIPHAAFEATRLSLDQMTSSCSSSSSILPMISTPNDNTVTVDSANATGYHRAGAMSARYNAHREGVVFSNENALQQQHPEFDSLFDQMHGTANGVLSAIGRHLSLSSVSSSSAAAVWTSSASATANNWFQENLGPTQSYSQWHIKRYLRRRPSMDEGYKQSNDSTSIDDDSAAAAKSVYVLLPPHTDPSLISIVILDRPGVQAGALGLQYNSNLDGDGWKEIPFSGHAVAIVFIGSVLHYITNGYFAACKHRVAVPSSDNNDSDDKDATPLRMAATLFVRPNPNAVLIVPASPLLQSAAHKRQRTPVPLTFAQWNAKTARNYEKAQQRSSKKQTSNLDSEILPAALNRQEKNDVLPSNC